MSLRVKFWLIMALTVVTAVLAYPREDVILHAIGLKHGSLHVEQGLDLKGGAYLAFQADLSKTAPADRNEAMNSLISVMQKRANPSGTSEISVTRQGSNQVVVELPGVANINDAIDRIGQTANLT